MNTTVDQIVKSRTKTKTKYHNNFANKNYTKMPGKDSRQDIQSKKNLKNK